MSLFLLILRLANGEGFMAKDLQGNKISVGDKIVIGADNGSTISIGFVTKVTKVFTYFVETFKGHNGQEYVSNGRRWHSRVCVVK